MRWKKFTIKTTVEAEDILSAILSDLGVGGVEIEDQVPLSEEEKQQMFVDILPDPPENDGTACVSFYLGEEADETALLADVRREIEELRNFMDPGEGTITESLTEDRDWINNWKEYFHQFTVDEFLIVPSWEEAEEADEDKILLRMDPGTAFGTGTHETTQLCLRQLKDYVTEKTEMLDVGTGSGILAIAALKSGAGHAVATDLDPSAISAAKDNLKANGIPEGSVEILQGNIISDKNVQDMVGYEKYDLVTANILAEVLLDLTPEIVRHMKRGGIYITSGILKEKESLITDAVRKAGLEVVRVLHQNDWVSVTAKKP